MSRGKWGERVGEEGSDGPLDAEGGTRREGFEEALGDGESLCADVSLDARDRRGREPEGSPRTTTPAPRTTWSTVPSGSRRGYRFLSSLDMGTRKGAEATRATTPFRVRFGRSPRGPVSAAPFTRSQAVSQSWLATDRWACATVQGTLALTDP